MVWSFVFSLTVTVGMAITILIILGVRACKKRNQQHLQQENGNQRQNQKVLKELLPLMAYLIIFYFMTLLPLSNRIHGAITQHPSFSLLALTHAIIAGQWSLFSSIALLIHIVVMKNYIKKMKKKLLTVVKSSKYPKTTGHTKDYAHFDSVSMNDDTCYNQPNESFVEDNFD